MGQRPVESTEWAAVFAARGVLTLDQESVNRWITTNGVLFNNLARCGPLPLRILELGCGPGRHAISAASLGHDVVAIDNDAQMIEHARENAKRAEIGGSIRFDVLDVGALGAYFTSGSFDVVTHGGLMEHFPSHLSIANSLRDQLAIAPFVLFDVPIQSSKNDLLFSRDSIFRQVWSSSYWTDTVLRGFTVVTAEVDAHDDPNMTDDLVILLAADQA